jgi:hypothetical protein
MIIIDGVFLPEELHYLRFGCRYDMCGGACCIVGDRGAPIETDEVSRIETYYSDIRPHLDLDAQNHIRSHGYYVDDGSVCSTACIRHQERCVFTAKNASGSVSCLLETVSRQLGIDTLRPISCRLFPLRIRSVNTLQIIDYEKWNECRHAWNHGPYLLDFCKDALQDRFGKEWMQKYIDYFLRFRKTIG